MEINPTWIIILGLCFDIVGAIFIVRGFLRNNPLGLSFLKYLKAVLYYSVYLSPKGYTMMQNEKIRETLEKMLLNEEDMLEKLRERNKMYEDPKKLINFLKSQGNDAFLGILLLTIGFIIQMFGNYFQNPP